MRSDLIRFAFLCQQANVVRVEERSSGSRVESGDGGEKEKEKRMKETKHQDGVQPPRQTSHHSIGMLTQIPTYTETFNDFEFSLRVSAWG